MPLLMCHNRRWVGVKLAITTSGSPLVKMTFTIFFINTVNPEISEFKSVSSNLTRVQTLDIVKILVWNKLLY